MLVLLGISLETGARLRLYQGATWKLMVGASLLVYLSLDLGLENSGSLKWSLASEKKMTIASLHTGEKLSMRPQGK